MKRASQIVLVVGWIVAGLIAGVPARADAADSRPLGETATRLPRGRLATSLEGSHSCVVVADGTVKCWGSNAFGQVGDGTTTTPSAAVRVTGITTAVAVTTGRDHSCALLVDATVRCWGANAVGQLGNGTTASSLTPVVVSGLTNAVSISAGSRHTCVRRSDGTVACWGSNEFGMLGDSTLVNRLTPVPAQGINNARMVAAGSEHTCAVRSDGTVACWGANGSGQLGLGHTFQRDVPIAVPDLAGVWLVATGRRYSCAQLGTGELRCWGTNESGQFGNATTTSSLTPVIAAIAPPGFLSVDAVMVGHGHACAFRGSGPNIVCWGQNAAGQLGRGVAGPPQLTPASVGGAPQAVELVAGLDRTCALDAVDTVRCWGENSAGQLGNGSTTDALAPSAVGGLGGAVSARGVAAGLGHTCAWRADGTVACWGRNASGALGDGTFLERHAPVPVTGPNNITAVVGGDHHTCATRASSTVFCWGANAAGQVNPNSTDDFIRTPVSPISAVNINLAAGIRHTIRILGRSDPAETVFGWGGNEALQLGNIEDDFFDGFFNAAPVAEPVAIVAGNQHSCALQARGTVQCWGSNQFGQLGNNSSATGANGVPQLVQGIVDAVAIGAGQFHTCAVLVGGTVRCWGRNDSGQLGDGTRIDRRASVVVGGVAAGAAVGVVAGRTYSCILRATGGVQCWGANSRGELGDTTFVDRLAPVFVQRAILFFQGQPIQSQVLNQVVALVGGNTHACAVRVNGQPVCWGNNENGQIGDGSTTNRPTALGVPSFLANIAPLGEVGHNGRRAEVTALVNCPEGAHFHVRVHLEQDGAHGHGEAAGKCEGGLEGVAVHISAQGRARFDEGAAEASAVIDVRLKGDVIDHQEWGRVVDLQPHP